MWKAYALLVLLPALSVEAQDKKGKGKGGGGQGANTYKSFKDEVPPELSAPDDKWINTKKGMTLADLKGVPVFVFFFSVT